MSPFQGHRHSTWYNFQREYRHFRPAGSQGPYLYRGSLYGLPAERAFPLMYVPLHYPFCSTYKAVQEHCLSKLSTKASISNILSCGFSSKAF